MTYRRIGPGAAGLFALLMLTGEALAQADGPEFLVDTTWQLVQTSTLLPERNSVMSRAVLLDAGGRKVLDLRPGPNDVSRLAPGVYFVCLESGVKRGASRLHKIIITN